MPYTLTKPTVAPKFSKDPEADKAKNLVNDRARCSEALQFARRGLKDEIEQCLADGVGINDQCGMGPTILSTACQYAKWDVAKMCLERNACVWLCNRTLRSNTQTIEIRDRNHVCVRPQRP